MRKFGSIRMAMRRSCSTKPPRWPLSIASSLLNHHLKKSLLRQWETRPMRNIFLVARREYLEQIRGRAFRVSTVLVPLLFAVIIAVAFLSGRGSGVGKHVIVAAPSVSLAEGIRSQIAN